MSREDSASLDVSSNVFQAEPDSDFYQRIGKGKSCYIPQQQNTFQYENTNWQNQRPASGYAIINHQSGVYNPSPTTNYHYDRVSGKLEKLNKILRS